ncbi:MAG TPA: anti-sigma factor antagonist [Gammaproteobacteria bacterium]|nr:anti-sigma factor antagonist [Gammaproteobacteria bacterium]
MSQRKAAVEVDESGEVPVIRIRGQFDFLLNSAFREAYRKFPSDSRFVLDMADVEAIDSSALGMLLMLREYAGNDPARVILRHLNEDVRRVLELSNFDRLFTLE